MKNPFQYGGVVSGDAFCNRKKEVEDFLRAMENGEKLFVYSERRFGKTSLVRFALDKLLAWVSRLHYSQVSSIKKLAYLQFQISDCKFQILVKRGLYGQG